MEREGGAITRLQSEAALVGMRGTGKTVISKPCKPQGFSAKVANDCLRSKVGEMIFLVVQNSAYFDPPELHWGTSQVGR